jgi:catechol 2,3-dioxygenase-like lactoylglutathione lyase family enzyme
VSGERGGPALRQVVLDGTDIRPLAEFYRQLLGLRYRRGDEPPAAGQPDPQGQDWLVLRGDGGRMQVAFQRVASLPEATWPEGPVPQQLHLDLTVADTAELDVQHERALTLGARLLDDQSEDPDEPLRVYADPAGHPFCIFVAVPPADDLAGFMDAYTRAWNARDLDAIVAAYATPCFVVKGGQVLRHEDEAAKARYFGDLLAGDRREGPHTWSIGHLERRPLGSDAAVVTVRWRSRRPDGTTVWEFLDSHLLASEQGRWRILGDVVHD